MPEAQPVPNDVDREARLQAVLVKVLEAEEAG